MAPCSCAVACQRARASARVRSSAASPGCEQAEEKERKRVQEEDRKRKALIEWQRKKKARRPAAPKIGKGRAAMEQKTSALQIPVQFVA